MHTLLRALVLGGALAFFPARAADKPTAPEITALPVSAIDDDKATFNATVTANGASTSVVFHYGLTATYDKKTTAVVVNADKVDQPIDADVTGLIGGRRYHFKVEATNGAGKDESADDTFDVPAFDPVLTVQPETDVAGGKATLNATLTANGTPGTAYFEYGPSATFATDPDRAMPSWSLDGSQVDFKASATVEGLKRAEPYLFRLVFEPADAALTSANGDFTTNNTPVATDDSLGIRSLGQSSLDVLRNDTDADGDADTLLIKELTAPSSGTVTKNADSTRVIYRPGKDFTGSDTFTYTVEDGFGGTDPATVTVRAFGVMLRGTHGGLLKDKNGNEVGYFRLTAVNSGKFTGQLFVDGERRTFSGTLGADGTFSGALTIDGDRIPFEITATPGETQTTLDADFGNGKWTASTTATADERTKRADRAGRYTVEFAGTGTTTGGEGENAATGAEPAGSGWAIVKLSAYGTARVKGRLADGRSFSTDGLVEVSADATTVTFFDDPRRTRVAGSLILGDAVTGTLHVDRKNGGDGRFSNGYEVTQTVSGARYVPPEDGQRAIEGTSDASGRNLTFTTSGGGEGTIFTHALSVNSKDKVTVLDPGFDDLRVKIDRKAGRFSARFNGATDDEHLKGTGVFIQNTSSSASALGRGAGLYNGTEQTGRITITGNGSGTAARSLR